MSGRGGYMDEETSGAMKKSILLYGLRNKCFVVIPSLTN